MINIETAKNQEKIWLRSAEHYDNKKNAFMASHCRKNAEHYTKIIKFSEPVYVTN